MIIIKFVLFDCMETLIDMTQLPERRDYAYWAYNGSTIEYLWKDFEEFFEEYKYAADYISEKLPEHRESSMMERFSFMVDRKRVGRDKDEFIKRIHQNYWANYSSKCYVHKETVELLEYLKDKYKLGVVSNFMVEDGIEDLIDKTCIKKYFEFIVTSVKNGWRKPHKNIYDEAIEKAGVSPQYICFVGDDYICDYEGPRKFGIQSFLYDRGMKYSDVPYRLMSLLELKRFL
ncbi:MAG: HAD family hydrolase [Bacillota bacterium]|nr:HAD family hydrolase [Bacillota bacterium]